MWKPNALPTTFGKDLCFLDILLEKDTTIKTDFSIPKKLVPYIDLPDFHPCTITKALVQYQMNIFGKEEELGLLNRLDNETAGFLYFAKNKEAFQRYRRLQSQGKVHKRYIAQIIWTPKESAFEIDMPIMHHKHKEDRMIFIRSPKDENKGRSKVHHPSTIVRVLHTDPTTNITTLLVGIYKGVRHQIRVHLAGIGYPVIGDPLYGKEKNAWNLCLWSVGFQIQD